MRKVEAVREGHRWAIKHGTGYLGHVDTEAEALEMVRALEGGGAPCSAARDASAGEAPADQYRGRIAA